MTEVEETTEDDELDETKTVLVELTVTVITELSGQELAEARAFVVLVLVVGDVC